MRSETPKDPNSPSTIRRPAPQHEVTKASENERDLLLQRVQPGLSGLIDGSLSSLAPIFAVVMSTQKPGYAFIAGLATAIGAGISMAFSEGLSDTGTVTERGNAWKRGVIVGGGTFLGGILHTLPFLIPDFLPALMVALAVVVIELLTLAWLRHRFFDVSFAWSLATVTLGGALISGVSIGLGALLGTAVAG
ncbi:VIT1/CCC1 transporter family protein [Streptomyces sp. NPDC060064]|uniref:VIT1/CCC1 transporter family protein n=1 Tax=Streptomyces sp. NPDC060064 TaxID=3347049 RepID=UPI0036C8A779